MLSLCIYVIWTHWIMNQPCPWIITFFIFDFIVCTHIIEFVLMILPGDSLIWCYCMYSYYRVCFNDSPWWFCNLMVLYVLHIIVCFNNYPWWFCNLIVLLNILVRSEKLELNLVNQGPVAGYRNISYFCHIIRYLQFFFSFQFAVVCHCNFRLFL